jgi:hypothetical protein
VRALVVIVGVVERVGSRLLGRGSELRLLFPENIDLILKVFIFTLQDFNQLIRLLQRIRHHLRFMQLRRIRQRLFLIRIKSGLKTRRLPLNLRIEILHLISSSDNDRFIVFFLNIMKLSMDSLTRKSPFF